MDDPQLQEAAKTLNRLKDAAEKGDREDFLKMGKDIEYFGYSKDYGKLYEELEMTEFAFKAKVNRASEFVEVVGPYLYPDNPVAKVNSRDWARVWQRKRHKIEEDYLDYTMVEGELSTHARRWVNQACTFGRGVLWTGFNPRKKIVQSVFDTVDNLLVDPDAKCMEEINWIARRRFKPRWELLRMYPKARDQILQLKKSTERQSDAKQNDSVVDLIEYHEFYFRVGLHHYSSSMADGKSEDESGVTVDDSPKKYCVAGDFVLSEGTWEIPFFQDDLWPCELLDLRSRPGKLWPAAPMEPGLPHLKALNYIYTLYMNRIRLAARTTLAVARYNGQGVEDDQLINLLKGKDFDVIRININGDMLKISDLIQQFKLDLDIPGLEKLAALISNEFEKSTGLYEVLYAGDANRQMRSAREVDLKEKTSKSRIEDMKRTVEESMDHLMRKTIFCARYLHPPEDIARLFGPAAGAAWGTLADPAQCDQEQQMRQQAMAGAMQAAQMQEQQNAMMQASMPPQVDPATGMAMPPPPPAPLPTPEQLDEMLGPEKFVSMDEWINEADREIEAGSMRRMDYSAQIDNMNVALNQLAPAVVTLPGGAQFVAAMAVEFTKVNRYSLEFQKAAADFYAAASAPPPPMPMPTNAPGTQPPKGPNPADSK